MQNILRNLSCEMKRTFARNPYSVLIGHIRVTPRTLYTSHASVRDPMVYVLGVEKSNHCGH